MVTYQCQAFQTEIKNDITKHRQCQMIALSGSEFCSVHTNKKEKHDRVLDDIVDKDHQEQIKVF